MKNPLSLLALFGSSLLSIKAAPVAEALPASPTQTPSAGGSSNPCAVLAASYAALDTGGDIFSIGLQPSQVLACLQDVQINQDIANAFVDYLLAFIPFQSTLDYLKNPPSGYEFPAVDLVGGLQNIQSKVRSGGYSNEYDFEYDIYTLMASAEDGHLTVLPNMLGSIIGGRPPLVSISDNGVDLPQVFFRCKAKQYHFA
jgi:hypothetical protein